MCKMMWMSCQPNHLRDYVLYIMFFFVKVTCVKKNPHMFNYDSHITKNELGVKSTSVNILLHVKS